MDQFPLSIVVPMYNVRPYVRQALNSLKNQSFREFEVLIVNDGSTDGCLEIANEFAASDSRFRVINQPNGGYGKAVNAGMVQAKGEYIGILEPDDIAKADMFETLLTAAKKHDADVVRSDFCMFYDFSESEAPPTETVLKNSLSRYLNGKSEGWIYLEEYPQILASAAAIWCCLFKRSFLNQHRIQVLETPGASYQDFPFFVETFFEAKKVYAVNRPLLYYRDSRPGSSSAKGGNKGFMVFDLYRNLHQKLKERNALFYEKVKGGLEYALFMQQYFFYKRLSPEYQTEFLNKVRTELKDFRPLPYVTGKHKLLYLALMHGGVKAYQVALGLGEKLTGKA